MLLLDALTHVDLLLDLLEIDVGNSALAIENLGNLLQGRALSLNEDEVHPDSFDEVPNLYFWLDPELGKRGP
jgi:hypothetical protein